jgi:hypothetical protein
MLLLGIWFCARRAVDGQRADRRWGERGVLAFWILLARVRLGRIRPSAEILNFGMGRPPGEGVAAEGFMRLNHLS